MTFKLSSLKYTSLSTVYIISVYIIANFFHADGTLYLKEGQRLDNLQKTFIVLEITVSYEKTESATEILILLIEHINKPPTFEDKSFTLTVEEEQVSYG